MSVLGKKWLIKNNDSQKPIFEKILANRGLHTPEMIGNFLYPENQDFHDPFLFRDMRKIVDRIKEAIKKNERIIVFGDYDVDGITATAILITVLQKLRARVSYRLPHRIEDGYGLSSKFIREFAEKNIDLIITVDCGISCFDEVKAANVAGITTIITDHHTIPPKIPDAFGILHPKLPSCDYPFAELTGAGVAFKLAHALLLEFFNNEEREKILNSLVEFASLGTVADLGLLIDENRLIVKKGLENLPRTNWLGLKKIMENAEVDHHDIYDTGKIGFRIAPRINAAGRIASPYLSLQLLLHDEESRILDFALELEKLNTERRSITENILQEARNIIDDLPALPPIIVLKNSQWHIGVLGLVAGKIAEIYNRPALIFQNKGLDLVGSGRSPQFFNIVAALSFCKAFITSYGGHAQAAGLSLPAQKFEHFFEAISAYAKEKIQNESLETVLSIDCEMDPAELNFELLDKLNLLKPFGMGNEEPLFIFKNLQPQSFSTVGREHQHLKMNLMIGQNKIDLIGFNFGQHLDEIFDKKIDIVGTPVQKIWREKTFLEIKISDFQISQT